MFALLFIIMHLYVFEWMRNCACILSFTYICITIADTSIKSRRFGTPLTDLAMPYLCACQGMNYQRHTSMLMSLYIFNDLRGLILVKLLTITVFIINPVGAFI